MSLLRFSAAPYSNSAPLVSYLNQVDSSAEIVYGVPSSHIQDLLNDKVDCALIPVVHLFQCSELTFINSVGVAADGAVRSVLLKCHKEVSQILTVLMDQASATSNVLAQLILEHHFGVSTETTNISKGVDAEVVIGDRALLGDAAKYVDIDLAEEWKKLTSLPFVFAVWAVKRESKKIDRIQDIVNKSANLGIQNMSSIAEQYANKFGRSSIFWEEYLSQNIDFRLTSKHIKGMNLFKSMVGVNELLSSHYE